MKHRHLVFSISVLHFEIHTFLTRCELRKTGKIFSFHNEQDSMKHGEKWFPEKKEKKCDLKFVSSSHSRYVPLSAELPLLSTFC